MSRTYGEYCLQCGTDSAREGHIGTIENRDVFLVQCTACGACYMWYQQIINIMPQHKLLEQDMEWKELLQIARDLINSGGLR